MASPDVQMLLRAGALNAECPRWRPEEQRLYWVDMRAPALHRLDPRTREDEAWPMPAWIGPIIDVFGTFGLAFGGASRLANAFSTPTFIVSSAQVQTERMGQSPTRRRRGSSSDSAGRSG